MQAHITTEPDFAAESQLFERFAAEMKMPLERMVGGFYVDHATQLAWSLWIRRAAIACSGLAVESVEGMNVVWGCV